MPALFSIFAVCSFSNAVTINRSSTWPAISRQPPFCSKLLPYSPSSISSSPTSAISIKKYSNSHSGLHRRAKGLRNNEKQIQRDPPGLPPLLFPKIIHNFQLAKGKVFQQPLQKDAPSVSHRKDSGRVHFLQLRNCRELGLRYPGLPDHCCLLGHIGFIVRRLLLHQFAVQLLQKSIEIA